MKPTAKRILISTAAVAALATGTIDTASAHVCSIYGYCHPVCLHQWVQVSLYPRQGYWTIPDEEPPPICFTSPALQIPLLEW